jgi:hypothetical protein
MAHLPEPGAALSQRRPPDRAQAQGQAADRHARAASPSDIERRSAQTATWQEPAPGSPTGLSPGSEPSTTTEPRDINKPPAKTGPAASSRPLPDEGRISGCCKTAPRFAPPRPRGHRFYERNKPLTCGAPLRNRTVDLLLTIRTLLGSPGQGQSRRLGASNRQGAAETCQRPRDARPPEAGSFAAGTSCRMRPPPRSSPIPEAECCPVAPSPTVG